MEYTARQVAEQLGMHKTTITRIAAKYSIGTRFGMQLKFTEADIAKILQNLGQSGGVKMKAGNKLWQLRKDLAEKRKNVVD